MGLWNESPVVGCGQPQWAGSAAAHRSRLCRSGRCLSGSSNRTRRLACLSSRRRSPPLRSCSASQLGCDRTPLPQCAAGCMFWVSSVGHCIYPRRSCSRRCAAGAAATGSVRAILLGASAAGSLRHCAPLWLQGSAGCERATGQPDGRSHAWGGVLRAPVCRWQPHAQVRALFYAAHCTSRRTPSAACCLLHAAASSARRARARPSRCHQCHQTNARLSRRRSQPAGGALPPTSPQSHNRPA